MPYSVKCKNAKNEAKTHVRMARGPSRRRGRQKTGV